MIIPLGQVSLYLALLLAALAGLSLVLAATRRDMLAARTGRDALVGCALVVWLAVGALALAFVQNDFRLRYVAGYSDSTLPAAYRLSALWAGPEGSLLLWTAIAATVALVLVLSRPLDRCSAAGSAAMSAALLLFLAVLNFDRAAAAAGRWPLAATAFAPVENIPVDGDGLKLQLQTWAMAVHPPVLFAGYALLAAPFAIALGNLVTGRLTAGLDLLRRFLLLGWAFLTAGIALGAWWAYTELGWGGYWAWDPVENASLVPWLVASAALHALSLARRQGRLPATALACRAGLALSALAFLACLAATYITRGGFVQSVHGYAAMPQSGLFGWLLANAYPGFILAALVVLVVALLIRQRRDRQALQGTGEKASASRAEGAQAILTCAAALVLVVFATAVLAGTLLPTLLKELGGMSYGLAPERFDRLAAVFGSILLVLLETTAILAVARKGFAGLKSPTGAARLAAHAGFVILAAGLAGSHLIKDEARVRLSRGAAVQFAGYTIRHEGLAESRRQDPPQVSVTARLSATRGTPGTRELVLEPSFTFDPRHDDQRGRVAIDVGWLRDLNVSLDGYDLASQEITVSLRRMGLVAWLWIGAGLLVLAGFAAALCPARAANTKEASP